MKIIYKFLIVVCICMISTNTSYSQPYHYPVLPGDDLLNNSTNYFKSENWAKGFSFENNSMIKQDSIMRNFDINSYDIIPESNDETIYIKILTPLGHQPNNNHWPVFSHTWTEEKIEQCNQAWLYSGGLFKSSGTCTFIEMNNEMTNHTVRCMEIDGDNIYIGTDNGIYVSTNYGDTWLGQGEDGINNLPGNIVYAISVSSNTFFTGTDVGIHVSTNSGETWTQSLPSKTITCIEHGNINDIYIGAENQDVYKSINYGLSWNSTTLSKPTFCLKFDTGNLYAGTSQSSNYLMKSTDGGTSWVRLWWEDKVISIYINGSNIYIGTDIKGCYLSNNGGQSFNQINNGLPKHPLSNEYYSVNSLQEYKGEIYAATENGLYKTELPTISWSTCYVRDNYFNREVEESTKMIFINNNPYDLWVACYGGPKWGTASMIDDYEYPFNPENFPNYNCHAFAWHLSEGGVSGVSLPGPNSMSYTPTDDYSEWEKQNWDYIQTEWDDPLWDKVTYNEDHSGIKSSENDPNETVEENLIIESKWGNNGPLVEHKLWENPWWSQSSTTITYWKSKKVVSRPTEQATFENQCIGRQIITNDETIIKGDETIDFYVAPMYEHKINLKPGFHAVKGCNFHAFIKDYYIDDDEIKQPCKIPWEEEPDKSGEQEYYANINKVNSSSDTIFNKDNSSSAVSLATSTKDNIIHQIDTIPCKRETDPFKFSGKGSGTEEDPYQITNVNQLGEMCYDFFGDHYWVLMNDIDASETRHWNPRIFNGDTLDYAGFGGIPGNDIRSLDGRGHVIRNLYTYNPHGGRITFMNTNCFTIKRVGFENFHFEGKGVFSLFHVSYKEVDFIIEECYLTGKIEGTKSENWNTVVFGDITNNAIVRNCYSEVIVISDSTVTNFTKNYGNESKVVNCYVTGSTISPKVNSPFDYTGNVISCFWDNEKIGITEPAGKGLGLPTSEMMKRSTFESAGWDFDSVWYIDEGMNYPKLRAFKKDTIDVTDKSQTVNEYLINAFPNPFINSTEIKYSIPTSSSVSIIIYNIFGVQVKEVLNAPFLPDGSYKMVIDASDFPTGVYYIILKAGRELLMKQIVVIK